MAFDAKGMAVRLREHLVKDILPFWADHALDRERGGYYPELERDGRPGRRRRKCLMMQIRTVDAFVIGYKVTGDSRYLDCARHGYEFAVSTMYAPEDNRWICAVERDGTPVEERIRAFDLTAVAHGMASYASVTKGIEAMTLALGAFGQLETFFQDRRRGGFFERLGPDLEVNRDSKTLDAHLHAIEAFFELTDAAADPSAAHALMSLLDLLIAKTQGYDDFIPLFEKYTEDWDEFGDESPRIKFGHLLKAAWLYLKAYQRVQKKEYLDFARGQLDYVIQWGIDPRGGVYWSGTADGEVGNANYPWWAQAEAIAALSRIWRVQRRDEDARLLERLANYCLEHFHDREFGEWYAMLGPGNEVVDTRKAHETKCPYPLVRALVAAVEDLEENDEG